jgi:hypothetical protein
MHDDELHEKALIYGTDKKLSKIRRLIRSAAIVSDDIHSKGRFNARDWHVAHAPRKELNNPHACRVSRLVRGLHRDYHRAVGVSSR